MSPSPASPRSSRHIGWCLALLALFVLNLQGLQHYLPRMLASADLCVADAEAAGRLQPDGAGVAHHGCDLCCSQAHAPLIPPGAAHATSLWQPTVLQVAAVGDSPLRSRVWSPSPRGPPLHA